MGLAVLNTWVVDYSVLVLFIRLFLLIFSSSVAGGLFVFHLLLLVLLLLLLLLDAQMDDYEWEAIDFPELVLTEVWRSEELDEVNPLFDGQINKLTQVGV
jgi:hypothetical protein